MANVFLQTSEWAAAKYIAKSLESLAEVDWEIKNFQLLENYRGNIKDLIKQRPYDLIIVHPSEIEYALESNERQDQAKVESAVASYFNDVLAAARKGWIPVIVLGDTEFRSESHSWMRDQIAVHLASFVRDFGNEGSKWYFNISKKLGINQPNPDYKRSMEELGLTLERVLSKEPVNT